MSAVTAQTEDLLSAVALLSDLPERGLVRGQVGTIVEPLDEATALVEFSDNEGRAYAIVPCPRGFAGFADRAARRVRWLSWRAHSHKRDATMASG
jgi:hypothetical protein